jgi:ATP phosphoribosyltransferase
MLRATDVPTYVQYWRRRRGSGRQDVLLGTRRDSSSRSIWASPLPSVVAVKRSYDWKGTVQRGARIRVATKYVKTAREHFAAKGMHVDLIKLYGSMELAPLVGLADAIVDLVSTGNTLKANDLVAVEDIMPISARLVVNPGALKMKRDVVQPLLDALGRVTQAGGAVSVR